MTMRLAYKIFKEIESKDYDIQEKGEAIYEVSKMATHNGITKNEMLNVIKFLLSLAYDLPESEADEK